ncbi:MAG: hypothetical protein RSD04_04425 [Clostridia bacterium]
MTKQSRQARFAERAKSEKDEIVECQKVINFCFLLAEFVRRKECPFERNRLTYHSQLPVNCVFPV